MRQEERRGGREREGGGREGGMNSDAIDQYGCSLLSREFNTEGWREGQEGDTGREGYREEGWREVET